MAADITVSLHYFLTDVSLRVENATLPHDRLCSDYLIPCFTPLAITTMIFSLIRQPWVPSVRGDGNIHLAFNPSLRPSRANQLQPRLHVRAPVCQIPTDRDRAILRRARL